MNELEELLGRGLGDPDIIMFYPGEQEESERLSRFREQQKRIEFPNTKEFKESQAIWSEAHKPREHEVVDFNRVYCPVYDRVRPEWLCSNEHDGDFKEVIDMEE